MSRTDEIKILQQQYIEVMIVAEELREEFKFQVKLSRAISFGNEHHVLRFSKLG